MGGRGTKGAKSMATPGKKGTSKASATSDFATEVMAQNGKMIDLSEFPLRYGKADPHLDGENRKNTEDFERRARTLDHEESQFIMNGKLYQFSGDEGSVEIPGYVVELSDVMTHNHPRRHKELGGTFSYSGVEGQGDLDVFLMTSMKTMRATTAEGTYSITKLRNKFDAVGFEDYLKAGYLPRVEEYNETAKALKIAYLTDEIEQKEYVLKARKAFNKCLVDLHNYIWAGQKKYGYHYTLERNP